MMYSAEQVQEWIAWDIYYASVCAMCCHPGNREAGMTVADAARVADEMLAQRRLRGFVRSEDC